MENTKNKVTLTPAERMAAEARIKALRAEANELSKALKADAANQAAEAPAAEVVEEAPVEEVPETTEEVVEEVPVEEVPEATEEAAEAPVEETKKPVKAKKRGGKILAALAVFSWAALMTVLVASMVIKDRNNVEVPPVGSGSQVETPGGTVNPGIVLSEGFQSGIVNIAKSLTDDEVTANVDILVKNIGEDKLVELVGKYGELSVQKAIAEYLAFVPEVKMQQYIANNGLNYNPNAADDYSQKLDATDEAYREATGKNPNGALMSLEGYDTYKSNREAMKTLIIESGDTALLAWYEAKTDGYDLMIQQNKDTETALAYKETVKTEIITSQGAVKLLEIQLEQEANGTLAVMDNVSMEYTEAYNTFILNNYIYVIAD